jgi:hypothetical protein
MTVYSGVRQASAGVAAITNIAQTWLKLKFDFYALAVCSAYGGFSLQHQE